MHPDLPPACPQNNFRNEKDFKTLYCIYAKRFKKIGCECSCECSFIQFKVHLTPNFFSAQINLHIMLSKSPQKCLICLNPRLSMPRRS